MSDSIQRSKIYMTPNGHSSLQNELDYLIHDERPKIVEKVRWAASNGDRSENGDYIYGKKRLREIDKRVRYLTKRLGNAHIVDPKLQQEQEKIFFGATVSYLQEDGSENTITIVGIDEANMSENKISYISPVARALFKAEEGDSVEVETPQGLVSLEITQVKY